MRKYFTVYFVILGILCIFVRPVFADEQDVATLFQEIPPAKYVVNPYLPYSYEDMIEDIALLAAMYPDIIKTKSVGKSVEGREMQAVELGKGEKKIFLCGSIHAREYISSAYVMYFVDRAAFDYKNNTVRDGHNVQNILDNITFCILPMVNPDGVNLVQNGWDAAQNADNLKKMIRRDGAKQYGYQSWKANINGVDLNNGFVYGWEENQRVSAPASAGFKGTSPMSEPELQALTSYMENIQPSAVLAIHAQGKVLYLSQPDEIAKKIAGNLMQNTGYQPQKISSAYGSFLDYVSNKFNVFYACVELCNYVGPYPYDNSKFDTVWNSAKDVCYIVAEGLL